MPARAGSPTAKRCNKAPSKGQRKATGPVVATAALGVTGGGALVTAPALAAAAGPVGGVATGLAGTGRPVVGALANGADVEGAAGLLAVALPGAVSRKFCPTKIVYGAA